MVMVMVKSMVKAMVKSREWEKASLLLWTEVHLGTSFNFILKASIHQKFIQELEKDKTRDHSRHCSNLSALFG